MQVGADVFVGAAVLVGASVVGRCVRDRPAVAAGPLEPQPVQVVVTDRGRPIARLNGIKQRRDSAQVQQALAAITFAAESGTGNLLDLSIRAMRLRATVGEVSDALETVYGRHRADTQKVTGVYAAAYDSAEGWETLKTEINAFAEAQGRRPRVMISKLGQDGHDRGAKVVATAMADLGFDIDIGPLFQTPEEAARQAVENDVHAVAMSSLAAGHKTLLPQLRKALDDLGRDDIMVISNIRDDGNDATFIQAPSISLSAALAIGGDFFEVLNLSPETGGVFIADDSEREKTWRIDAVPWTKERSEAFAGMHNQGKRLLILFDWWWSKHANGSG